MNDWPRIIVVIALTAVAVSAAAQDIVNQFGAPGFDSRGLAWDGQYLWCADAAKDSLFQIDPASGHVVHAIFFDLNGAYGGGITWGGDAALWETRVQYFYKLNASDGQELANFHCPGG